MSSDRFMTVENHERLSRFFFFSKWFTPSTKRISPNAFVPHPYINLSVSCTQGLTEAEIWETGKVTQNLLREPRKLYARGDISTKHILTERLQLIRDDKPLYHANISNWPEDREIQREIAVRIVAQASLSMNPSHE